MVEENAMFEFTQVVNANESGFVVNARRAQHRATTMAIPHGPQLANIPNGFR